MSDCAQNFSYRLICLDNGKVFHSSTEAMKWLGHSELSRSNLHRLFRNPKYRLGGYQWKIEKTRKFSRLRNIITKKIYNDGYEAAQSLWSRPLTKDEKAKISQQIRISAKEGASNRFTKLDGQKIPIGQWEFCS